MDEEKELKVEELKQYGFKITYKNGEFRIRRPYMMERKISVESLIDLLKVL